ncbi:unnamed protein product [Lactuca virosa]|uniref:Uncharacterized protein n=1 Tax=Lactuca virosa TaxID=75947 RepID=A0AAU9N2U5_9ASTR|nr:unnamed protein product [Lactuca virosa]
MASRSRRNQPRNCPEFLWCNFPRVVSPEVLAQWNGKLDWMRQRKVAFPSPPVPVDNEYNQPKVGRGQGPDIGRIFLWALVTPDVYLDIPFLLADFLSIRVGKDRCESPLYGGMLITCIARSFGVFDKHDAMFFTI